MSDLWRQPQEDVKLSESFVRLRGALIVAAVNPQPWPARVIDAIDSLLKFAVAEPEAAAAVLTPYLRDCSDEDAERYRELIGGVSSLLREGRDEGRAGEILPASSELVLAGAIVALIGERVRAGEGDRLAELGGELVEFTLTPYLGADRAKHWACRYAHSS